MAIDLVSVLGTLRRDFAQDVRFSVRLSGGGALLFECMFACKVMTLGFNVVELDTARIGPEALVSSAFVRAGIPLAGDENAV